MIAPVAIAGILIMATLANQAYSSSGSLTSVKCKITKHGHTKCKTKTTGGASNTGNMAQESSNTGNGATNTATIQLKCTTGYIWLPTGGFRHCALGAMVNAPQGASNTHPGLKSESSTGRNTAQGASNTGNAAQGASNTGQGGPSAQTSVGNVGQGATSSQAGHCKPAITQLSAQWYPPYRNYMIRGTLTCGGSGLSGKTITLTSTHVSYFGRIGTVVTGEEGSFFKSYKPASRAKPLTTLSAWYLGGPIGGGIPSKVVTVTGGPSQQQSSNTENAAQQSSNNANTEQEKGTSNNGNTQHEGSNNGNTQQENEAGGGSK